MKKDKKGFTLIELLAVIVVLALIMILAVPAILNSMNNAKKKTFQMYGQRLLENALSEHESQKLLNTVTAKTYGTGENAPLCYSIEDLGFDTHGSYQGFVAVHASDLLGETSYTLYLTDNTFAYNATASLDVQSNTKTISTKAEDIQAVKTALDQCS